MAAKDGVDARDPNTFDRTNFEGTLHVIEAAMETGVRKLIYTSTVMTLGPSNGAPADEKTQRKTPFFNDYDRTKALAEQAVAEAEAIQRGLPALIVSPAFVYGPTRQLRNNSFNAYLLAASNGRFVLLPGRGNQIVNAVYIDDVVDGHLCALEKGQVGERYILGGENIRLCEAIEVLSRLSLKRRLTLNAPLSFLKLMGHIVLKMERFRGRDARLTPRAVEMYRHDWAYSSEKAAAQIAYRHRPLREGLQATLAWLADERKRPWQASHL